MPLPPYIKVTSKKPGRCSGYLIRRVLLNSAPKICNLLSLPIFDRMNQIRQTQVFITQDHKTNPEWYHTSHESFPGPRLPRSKRDIISSRDSKLIGAKLKNEPLCTERAPNSNMNKNSISGLFGGAYYPGNCRTSKPGLGCPETLL